MRRNKFHLCLISLIILSFCFGMIGCKRKISIPEKGHLRIHLGTEPPSLDPTLTDSVVSFKIIENILEGLVEYDEQLNLRPAGAHSWTVSSDGRTYTFLLKDNVWTDGKPVTADDFIFALQRALSPITPSVAVPLLFSITGAADFKYSRTADWNRVGVRALNPKSLQIELAYPEPSFLHVLAQPITFPQRRDIVQPMGERAWLDPEKMVTNGPFRLAAWKHDSRIELLRNNLYVGDSPSLERITALIVSETRTALTLYEGGEIDILEQMPPFALREYKRSSELKIYPDFSTYFVAFNTRKAPFDDVRVRKAFVMSINKSAIVNIVDGGVKPAKSFVPPGIVGFNPAIGLFPNYKGANSLLAAAGFDPRQDGKSFPQIIAGFNTNERHQLIMEWLQQQWKDILKIRVSLDNREWKSYLDWLVSDPPHIFRYAWLAAIPDAIAHLTLFESTNPSNFGKWSNGHYDQLISKIRRTPPSAERSLLIDEAQRILVEQEAVLIPIYFYTRPILSKPYVRGLRVTGRGVLPYKSVSIQTGRP
ncbi:MAG: peptide ABC transporter substrate-binding protein [Deltaproteobacteria bacterium]|nr:peptide ABC transporter substrate-binding protein [Deltaproteobacteria bacterium]